MDMYKKKSFKFVHERISRDFRHAETLKARESSRFKRLSMIRSICDSMEVMCDDSVETSKENVDVNQQTRNGQKSSRKTPKPMRLEMLQKWKEEKLMKKQLDMKMKKKPFYAGSSSGNQLASLQFGSTLENSQNFKSSFINQSKTTFNVSRAVNNKVINKPAPLQPTKAPGNSKLVPPSTFQSSRIPNNSRMTGYAVKSKTTNIPGFAKKANNVAPKPGVIVSNKGSSAGSVAGGIKPSLSKITPTSNLGSSKQNESSTSKVTSQGLAFPKSTFLKPLSKPVQKVDSTVSKAVSGIPNKFSKGIPRPPTKIATISSNATTSALKAPNKSASKNITIRKRVSDKSTASVKQEQSAYNTNDGKLPPGSRMNKASVENEYDIALLRTPDINQIKQIIDAKMQSMKLQQEMRDKDNERATSFSGEDPGINRDLCENVISKSLDKEDSVEQIKEDTLIKDDTLKSTSVEENISALCDTSEANDDKVFSSSPVNDIPAKSQPDDGLISLLGTPDMNQIKKVTETKVQLMKLEKENQDEADMMNTPKHDLFKVPEIIECKEKTESTKEDLLLEQSLENIPDLTLNCDLSVIKIEASFAPSDFKFQPPAGLSAFSFDDTCEAAENRNLKFLSRTSTPTREARERASDHFSKTHKNSTGKDCPLINKKDSPPKASDDLANEIITDIDNPFQIVLDNEELLISETPDILINNETFEEEEELIVKEDLCEKSPRKFLGKEDFEEKLNDEPEFLVDEMSANIQAEESVLSLPETPDIDQFKQVIISQMQSVKLEQEKRDKGDIATEKEVSSKLKKSTGGAISKRVSVHRKSVLQSIAETSEADDSILKSPMKSVKSRNSPCTPRRSSRLSAKVSQVLDDQSESTVKEDSVLITPVAPVRRSQRFSKPIPKSFQFDDVLSPFKGKKSSFFNLTPRRSMRLIDLSTDISEIVNTPEKSESAKTNLTADFERLALHSDENIDPNACLIDFESSPDPVLNMKSKKVSLLYSPEKRKSIRKSIRGDLISFSPNNN